jgi:predicted GNAT family N-acyltransferase
MSTKPTIILSLASWPRHQAELYAVRYQVFVQEQQVPEELEQDEHDPQSTHILARSVNGTAVGTGRLLPDGHIGRVAVLAQWRQHGIGKRLMQALIEQARLQGHSTVELNAQVDALDFYRKLSFQAQGETFLDAGIVHQSMSLQL